MEKNVNVLTKNEQEFFADSHHKDCNAMNIIFYNMFLEDAKPNFIEPLFIMTPTWL